MRATTSLLEQGGVRCPTVADHVGAMLAYRRTHPEVGSTAMT